MIVDAHGVDLLDICAGGHLTQQTTQWLGERSQALRSTMSTAAASFFNTAQNMYSMISESAAVQALRNLTTKKDNLWQSNNIVYLETLAELQTAGPIMQRWVMAHERLRTMYLNNEVDGYGGSYNNIQGDAVGERQFDYRRVMDGVMYTDKKEFGYKNYHEDIKSDRKLRLHEKVDIIRMWNAIDGHLDAGEEDPTSVVGNLLG
ncbi:hypothetical protein FDI90_gp324 [Pseudomonas phage PA7]|uniref:Uncharacterized protein n=1 Tax=Pseudomonas phage PA7 TaxID=347330 RepID=I7DB45_9CAUD|nr:hypothetical protein FDI90_gp324 [Pseudomonas phage PA7]AFO71131.1 hypothetical protein [Pseudomonas phage PA7]BDR25174.1 hypothetical protein RVBP14_3400 [Pseudomonas phage sp. Brmt]